MSAHTYPSRARASPPAGPIPWHPLDSICEEPFLAPLVMDDPDSPMAVWYMNVRLEFIDPFWYVTAEHPRFYDPHGSLWVLIGPGMYHSDHENCLIVGAAGYVLACLDRMGT